MADGLATKAMQALLNGEVDWDTADIRLILTDADYVVDLALHDFLDDVLVGDRIGTAVALSGRTITDGVFDAADLTYGATDRQANGAWIYLHTGTDATSRLLFWIDGKVRVKMAAAAASGATNLDVDPLEGPIPSGTTFTIGGVSVTTSAAVVAGARDIPVNATSAAIAVDSVGEANKGTGWPIAASAGGVQINWNDGASRIFRLIRANS